MKTVTIEIKVEVDDEVKWAAVDEVGEICTFKETPYIGWGMYREGLWIGSESCSRIKVANWKETLRKVE